MSNNLQTKIGVIGAIKELTKPPNWLPKESERS